MGEQLRPDEILKLLNNLTIEQILDHLYERVGELNEQAENDQSTIANLQDEIGELDTELSTLRSDPVTNDIKDVIDHYAGRMPMQDWALDQAMARIEQWWDRM